MGLLMWRLRFRRWLLRFGTQCAARNPHDHGMPGQSVLASGAPLRSPRRHVAGGVALMAERIATWSGELQLSGVTLHVHVLEDGTRIIEAADLHALLQAWEQGAEVDEAEAEAFGRWQRGGDPP